MWNKLLICPSFETVKKIMERKVSACIELQPVNLEKFLDNPSANENISFSRCEVTSCYYEYPLKILSPQCISNNNCQWIYFVIFGGGLVEGDNINISVKVGNNCCALFTTLAFPKVYCCENGFDSQQHVQYDICSHALLCVLPDPLVCYKQASYIQTQTYHLEPDANVVSLDWFTSGRYERGEHWDFSRLKCVSTFYMNNKLIFKEAQNIQNSNFMSLQEAMIAYHCVGTCFIIGPYLSFLYMKILSELGRCHSYGETYCSDSLFAVSPLYLKEVTQPVGCVIRFADESVPKAVQRINKLLEPLTEIFGENPFEHK